jgi:hypothetical protein
MVEARSLSTMEAPRQKEMKESATVVAITTLAVEELLLGGCEESGADIAGGRNAPLTRFYGRRDESATGRQQARGRAAGGGAGAATNAHHP